GFFLEVIGLTGGCLFVQWFQESGSLGENLGPRTWSRDIRCCAVLLQDQTSPPVSSTTYYRNIKIHHMYGT
ncbi:hypothetical protein Hamer_G029690, partial [Homarus americanus]